jgi:hypothetical protein
MPSLEIAINVEEQSMPWAAAGSNVTMHLTSVDPVHLGIGSVLCPTTDVVPLATLFTARIIVFDVIVPIAAGTSVCYCDRKTDIYIADEGCRRLSCSTTPGMCQRQSRGYCQSSTGQMGQLSSGILGVLFFSPITSVSSLYDIPAFSPRAPRQRFKSLCEPTPCRVLLQVQGLSL